MRQLLRFIGRGIYTAWATWWFIFPFLVTFPIQWVASKVPSWRWIIPKINRLWSVFSIFMWGVPVEVVRPSKAPLPRPCVYVANHGSYIDILVMFRSIPGFLNMMGKASLAKVPVWGPIFGSVYVTVDRGSAVSRGRAMVAAKRTLKAGNSIAIFPEGRISTTPGAQLLPFHDGAFQMAIEAGVPIVPVGMPLNHMFMPDVKGKLRVRYHRLKIVFHDPIPTTGLTLEDIPALKQRVAELLTGDFLPEGAVKPQANVWRGEAPADAV
ncbi:lysophospholipid acyltransferase family protein [Hymenobacter sp. ASUV-10]|uniref:Lysophospholipid acyltransferase family protein n=1 Tax=Hymenobacter aranciens TaxID=3063996 RepID=A0ABT9BEF9_9BACT|nr:lysophospholipid acyltransferase family protein [Hymenobacter sp. ASUV-10]MDO7876644.1 lysophospholipid acyltransferase family protein [Hymenobacter sp. ASUV-10]